MAKAKTLEQKFEDVLIQLDEIRILVKYLSECSYDGVDGEEVGIPYKCIDRLLYQACFNLAGIQESIIKKAD